MKKSIEESIAASPAPRITDYFSQGFNIVFKKPGFFVGFILIFFAINFGISLIPLGNYVFSFFFQPLLLVGCYVVADRINYQEDVEFSYFFDGFRNKMGNILLTNLLMVVILIVPMLLIFGGVFYAFGLSNLEALLMGRTPDYSTFSGLTGTSIALFIIGFIIFAYFGISYALALHMARFKDLSPWESLEASRKLIGKNFLSFFMFFILAFLVNLAGALLLLVGLLVTIPATYVALYIAFDDLVKAREEQDADDRIMDHFIVEQ